jgi:exodeoxyribonuclease VII large subunit
MIMNEASPGFGPAGEPGFDRPRLLAEEMPGDNAPALSVSELSGALKRSVEEAFGHVRVRGEISGFKRVASGHCYLALKDDRAVIDGVIWKGSAAALRFRPEDGIEVIATGKLTTYPGRSKYQIVIERMELAGQGALMALLDQRRRMLAAEGLFDADRKRPLPFMPRVIGVVTSPTGAVIRDILHRLEDRCPTHVILWPVIVQGDSAAAQIATAIRGFGTMAAGGPIRRPDLLIVGRGGGSIEDLWAFNEEAVVRAVAESPIPIISAVGHETDTTLCDFAADLRAPTPTAAAELAVPVRADLLGAVRDMGLRAERLARRYHERATERFDGIARQLPGPDTLLDASRQRLDEVGDRLPRALARRLAVAGGELAQISGALRPRLIEDRLHRGEAALRAEMRAAGRAVQNTKDHAGQRLSATAARLRHEPIGKRIADGHDRLDRLWRLADSLHPDRPLRLGYVRVERRTGGVVASADVARAAAALTLHFVDGAVDVRVEKPTQSPYGKDDKAAQPKLF